MENGNGRNKERLSKNHTMINISKFRSESISGRDTDFLRVLKSGLKKTKEKFKNLQKFVPKDSVS